MATKKRKTWRSKLTKTELLHLKEMNVKNKSDLARTFSVQKDWRDTNGSIEPCWACRIIAEKLGFPV